VFLALGRIGNFINGQIAGYPSGRHRSRDQ
jgi:prolipoprotein diacylglyceryltransferase